MLYQHHRKRSNLAEITKDVAEVLPNGVPSCRNYLLIRSALAKGFSCIGVSAKNVRVFIPRCIDEGIELIISYHPLPKPDLSGHMVLVTNADSEYVYVNDPEKSAEEGVNVPLPFDFLEENMKSRLGSSEIVRDNTILLLKPIAKGSAVDNQTLPFSFLDDLITAEIDPTTNTWIDR